jgi:SAM-dependent methyltransferase
MFIRKALRIPLILKRIGWKEAFCLLYIYCFAPTIMQVLPLYVKFYRRYARLRDELLVTKELRRLSSHKRELLQYGGDKYQTRVEEFGISEEALRDIKELHSRQREVVIADIDQDGFILSHVGKIANVPMVSEEGFRARKRFKLCIVSLQGVLGVKKDYRGHKLTFVRELKILDRLHKAGCNVPGILDIDFDKYHITRTYISGMVLREELAKRGAKLRDRDVDGKEEFEAITGQESRLKRIEEGKKYLYDVVDRRFVDELHSQFQQIHACSVQVNDVKYGNVIIEARTGVPFLVDFDSSYNLSGLGRNSLRLACDDDIVKFNLHFGTDYFTYRDLRKRIGRRDVPHAKDWYAPVYLGYGLRIGRLWDVELGYGRWQYILQSNLPPFAGKRILDLGANNGFNCIQLLRHGAREVIGVEMGEGQIAQGEFVKAAMEWSDNRRYNLRFIHSNMAEIPKMDLGRFDMAMALCSIYYLDDRTIGELLEHLNEISDKVVLQCNIANNIGRKCAGTYEKASVEYAKKSLGEHGFAKIRVIAPPLYFRPLVIGSKN